MAGWKKDENGAIMVDENGNPIYVHEDGKEAGWNVPGTLNSIKELTAAKTGLKAERDTLKAFQESLVTELGEDVLKDPAKIKTALTTLNEVELGNLVNKGKESEVVAKALKDAEAKFAAEKTALELAKNELTASLQAKTEALRNEALLNAFATSEVVKKLAPKLPASMAVGTFGGNFKEEIVDGKATLIPHIDGEPMYSLKPERAGKVALFDEGFERMFNEYPHKAIFQPDQAGGPPGGSSGSGSGDIILSENDASDFQKWNAAQEAAAKAGSQVIVQ